MWHLRTQLGGDHGSVGLPVGFGDLRGLFQPDQLHDSVISCFLLPLSQPHGQRTLNLSGMDLHSLNVSASGRQLHLPMHDCASGCFPVDSNTLSAQARSTPADLQTSRF